MLKRPEITESLGVIAASGHCVARDASVQHPVTGCPLPRAQSGLHELISK